MLQVRHRASSGKAAANIWDFDVERRVLDVVIRQASAEPIAFTLPVCAPDRPRVGAYPIMRADSESWHVLPAVFRFDGDLLVPSNATIHPSMGAGQQLLLTYASTDVDEELMSL